MSDAVLGTSDQAFPYLVSCFRHLGFQDFCIINYSVIIFMCFGGASFHKRDFMSKKYSGSGVSIFVSRLVIQIADLFSEALVLFVFDLLLAL